MGWGNPGCVYRPRNERLESIATRSDLRVLVDGKLNMSHCSLVARRASPVLRCIKHSVTAGQGLSYCALGWGSLVSSAGEQFWCHNIRKIPSD